jgi:hypothetical protein
MDAVKDYQALIGGACTLIAAIIAFFAILRPAKHNAQLEQIATARSLWAELAAVGTRLRSDEISLREYTKRGEPFLPRTLDLSIYEDSPAAVGRLPPDYAFALVWQYKVMRDMNDRYAYFRNLNHDMRVAEHRERAGRLEKRAKDTADQVGQMLRKYYETAALPLEQADSALKSWAAKISTEAAPKKT